MQRDLDDVTEAELAVLQALWEHQPATIRQIIDAVYPHATAPDAKKPTVQKLLERIRPPESSGARAKFRLRSNHRDKTSAA